MGMGDLSSGGAVPALEMLLRFAGQRQRFIAGNIANISTPNYQPRDVSVQGFQKALSSAIEARRAKGGVGPLEWQETRELRRDLRGDLRLVPTEPSKNILFHDRNNRDLERMLQAQTENSFAYRVAVDLLRGRMEQLRAAIAERV